MHLPDDPAELAQLISQLEVSLGGDARWCPQEPTEKQQEFLALDCLEALYGGQAGGGKSSALLLAAAQHVHVPGYAAILFRRTYADLALPGALMDRAKDWWCPRPEVRWDDKLKVFTFPSGATISFGYLDTEHDRYRYQGSEFQFIGFDELTQFPEQWYRYLLSRLRRPTWLNVPLRARGASNPGGIGHEWVKRRFLDPDSTRPFIPAALADNPFLDADAYRKSLAELDPTTRAQLLEGQWIRDSGGLVYEYREDRNAIQQAPKCPNIILGVDYGYTDATAFAVLGWAPHEKTVYVLEAFKRHGLTPSDAADLVRDLQAKYGFGRIVADIGGLGKGYAEEARKRYHLPIEPADKRNKRGYIDLMNGDLRNGLIKVTPAARELVAEWCELPWDEDRKNHASGFDDHCSDACLYAWRAAWAFTEPDAPPPPPDEEQQHAQEQVRMRRQAERHFKGMRRGIVWRR